MRYTEIFKIKEIFESGKPVKLFLGKKECFVKRTCTTQYLTGVIYRVVLENDDLTVETGEIKWDTICKRVEWSSSNAVKLKWWIRIKMRWFNTSLYLIK